MKTPSKMIERVPYPIKNIAIKANNTVNPFLPSPRLFSAPKGVGEKNLDGTIEIIEKPKLLISQSMGVSAIRRIHKNVGISATSLVASIILFAAGSRGPMFFYQPPERLLNLNNALGALAGLVSAKSMRKVIGFERQFDEVDGYGFQTLVQVAHPVHRFDKKTGKLHIKETREVWNPKDTYVIENQKEANGLPVIPNLSKAMMSTYQELNENPPSHNNAILRQTPLLHKIW